MGNKATDEPKGNTDRESVSAPTSMEVKAALSAVGYLNETLSSCSTGGFSA